MSVPKTKLDLPQLRKEIREMMWWHPIHKLLKEELSAKGHWKAKKRGNPALGYKIAHERKKKNG
jgi:hypothetical protein